jgi:hypothetical protein
VQDPPAAPRPDIEAEWYRRRRAAKDGLALPEEFRLHDDEDGIAVRFPVVVGARLRVLALGGGRRARGLGIALLAILCFLAVAGEIVLLLVLAAMGLVFAIPFLILHSARRLVTVRAEGVEVAWWPVPIASRRLVGREIRQAFVRRRGDAIGIFPGDPDVGAAPEFDLWIVRPDGSQEILVGSLSSPEHAIYLERWLERRLGIPDDPVSGEYGI